MNLKIITTSPLLRENMLFFFCIFQRESAAFFFLHSHQNDSVCRAKMGTRMFWFWHWRSQYWSLVRLSNRTFCFPELIPFLRNDGYTLASGYCRDPSRFAATEKLNLMKLSVSTRGGWAHFLTQTHTRGQGAVKTEQEHQPGVSFSGAICIFVDHSCKRIYAFRYTTGKKNPTQNAKFLTLLRFIMWFTTFGMCLPCYPHCSLCSETGKGIRNLDGCEFKVISRKMLHGYTN